MVPILFQHITTLRQSPDWKQRHAALMAYTQTSMAYGKLWAVPITISKCIPPAIRYNCVKAHMGRCLR